MYAKREWGYRAIQDLFRESDTFALHSLEEESS
jgi:hypothetical protein